MNAEIRSTSAAPRPIRLKDYRPPDWLIDSVDLEFDLGQNQTRVRARLAIRRNHKGRRRPLVLDGQALKTVSVAVDGTRLSGREYDATDETLTIAAIPDSCVLETEVELCPQDNTALEGLYKSGTMLCTQCEAEGFRGITWFADRPDVMATYRVAIIAEKADYPVLLSNGNLIEATDLPGGRHRAVWQDPHRKPCYLFALVAGNLACVEDRFTTRSGRDVTLRIYVEPGNVDRCGWAMESLKRAMRWDEEVFGLEYDLDVFMIVAVNDFNMGAMENKGLNIFNAKYILAKPETATDGEYEFIESVIAHEYFHNWTGNRVTCRDWFQLSLKEGLTVFRDQQFSADMRGAAVKRISDVRMLRARQFPEDSGPLAHPVRPETYIEINNFYTATVYEKGAELVRMIHSLLGPDEFRRGMALYFQRHDGQAVTTDDFVAAMEDSSGIDLGQFRCWYAQAGTPVLTISGRHDPSTRVYEMTVRQSTPPTPGQKSKAPLLIPLAVGLLDEDGNDMVLRLDGQNSDGDPADPATTLLLKVTEPVQTFRFVDIDAKPTPSVLRGFSAPVIVEQDLGEKQRLHLMRHDSDLFNRWQAGQDIALRRLLRMIRDRQSGRKPEVDDRFIDALGGVLEDGSLDPAFADEMLALPGETVIADRMDRIDVEAVHEAREMLRHGIGTRLRHRLMETYHRLAGNRTADRADVGRRALKNRVLSYLMAGGGADIVALCLRQYTEADNMTDSIAALGLLANSESPDRDRALADFRQRWAADRLVLDKWFTVQATAVRRDTLDRVRRLMKDSVFSLTNPNKVRALIGAFAASNPVCFHAADGAGYEFLAGIVLKLNSVNPQVAARLLTPFGRWRRFDEARQKLMKTQLDRILADSGLSRDVYEIARKTRG